MRWLVCCLVGASAGCQVSPDFRNPKSPAADGLNTRDLIDPPAQRQYDTLLDTQEVFAVAERVKATVQAAKPGKRVDNVLCLSGGGNYGAYAAGVLCGWTARGDRPEFAVVTGISTGALIAPFAFLGAECDAQMKTFYTTLKTNDLYKLHAVTGLVSESLADTSKLARMMEDVLTPAMVERIAEEHEKGRRLYIGTTELDGKRFVVWDLGAMATEGTAASVELMRKVLLGSSAIPGFFPPSRIWVTVNGKPYLERHVDGGVSNALCFRPPFVPEEKRGDPAELALSGNNVYCIVAGKLYADPGVQKARSLSIAGNSVSTIIYAQTRGDLQRIWTLSALHGMNFHLASIPAEYPAPKSSTDFDPVKMTGMFDEGYRQACARTVWRTTPPGVGPGESGLMRRGVNLTYSPRGGPTVAGPDAPAGVIPLTPQGVPLPPGPVQK